MGRKLFDTEAACLNEGICWWKFKVWNYMLWTEYNGCIICLEIVIDILSQFRCNRACAEQWLPLQSNWC